MLCGKIGISKPEGKKDRLCEAFFYLKNLKFTFLEIFLSIFRLSCKDYQYFSLLELKYSSSVKARTRLK